MIEMTINGGHQAALRTTGRDLGETLKLGQPEPFDGTPKKLREFLTSLKAHFLYYPRTLRIDDGKV
jgi:hypothetical protein